MLSSTGKYCRQTSVISEDLIISGEVATVLIENDWLEQPPELTNHEAIIYAK